MNLQITPTEKKDFQRIVSFLSNFSLPVDDLSEGLPNFYKGQLEGEIIVVIGLEIYSQYALLRSMAVSEKYRNLGIGNMIYNEAIKCCLENKIKEVYLLTTTAEKFFGNKGYTIIDRDHVPTEVRQSQQFKTSCPASAIVMKKLI